MDNFDIDNHLKKLENEFNQQESIEEILATPQIDAFSILGFYNVFLSPSDNLDIDNKFPTPDDVKKVFRKKSLLLHPDKNPHDRASDCFEKLKKASLALSPSSDPDSKRRDLFNWLDEAKKESIRFTSPNQSQDERLNLIRSRFIQITKGQSERHQVVQKNLELAAQRTRELDESWKKKVELEKEWENTREERVAGWRAFAGKKSKKKSKDPWDIPPPQIIKGNSGTTSSGTSSKTTSSNTKPSYSPYPSSKPSSK